MDEKSGMGHPDAKTVIGWSETRAESAMREAKRRLDAVLRRRESLVNVEGSSPASVVRDDDSFSDADGGSHHQLTTPRANTRPNDDDYDADAGPFDHAKKRTPSRVGTRHDGFDPATPSIDSRDIDRSAGVGLAWVALALFAAFAALVIRRVRRRRRGWKRRQEGSSPLASRLARRRAL